MAKSEKFLTYKGKPLVRNGNTLYYGDPSEKYVIMMQILATKPVGEIEVASKVSMFKVPFHKRISIVSEFIRFTEKYLMLWSW